MERLLILGYNAIAGFSRSKRRNLRRFFHSCRFRDFDLLISNFALNLSRKYFVDRKSKAILSASFAIFRGILVWFIYRSLAGIGLALSIDFGQSFRVVCRAFSGL